MMQRWLLFAGLALMTAAAPIAPPVKPAFVANWAVDPTQSRIAFAATWLGKPVQGSFRRWNAQVDFDPSKPQAGKIMVVIDLASAITGDKSADGALPEADWFAVKAYPVARFASQHISKTVSGFTAMGSLTMRGKTLPLALPFRFVSNGKSAKVEAQITLDRRMWNLGMETDSSAEYVAFAVPVRIDLQAMRLR